MLTKDEVLHCSCCCCCCCVVTCLFIFSIYPSQDIRQYCHNPDVSHLILQQRWDGPHQPTMPMEYLISMGFADRALNTQLLEKHNNVLEDVLNELLDMQNEAFHV